MCRDYFTLKGTRSNEALHSVSIRVRECQGRVIILIGGVMAACSAGDRKVVGSSPSGTSLIPEANVVDVRVQPMQPPGLLCQILGNCM